ncbi:cobalamin B12-binding domain-containing protein [Neomoorella thermoacetica]|uniref:5-methyltetrahydrofolate--homocysteine S-methyltransferase n=2 Tax=Neomoorella thermoacetica TaxID=1525 RepID=Q2RLG8_MOOTA|nr:cobalamin-dependent protein [Moorella thermoacetica]AKX93133.1 methionine synthase [Moorella thermoacetica]AKX95780.1 methionine synthase [Moorella thermoacetica]OIQ52927.1 methionine synthase [Moorella thermoacetica]QCZ99591.1 Methionine synthase [Moorella thermoacetica]TYL07617.1 Methionine synthase [Moorella thermoacetica]
MLTDTLSKAMAELEEEQVLAQVKERLGGGVAPLEIVKTLQEGMVEVGNRFQSGEYFLSELIMAGEIMKGAMDILEPHLGGESGEHKGTIVIGTVKGDIHDLGKNIVIMLLKGAGYKVVDLGVDVPKERFVEALQETKAPLVGMSVLLTSCQEAMKETIEAIRGAGLDTRVVIGGNYIDETVKNYVGADYYATTATDGVKVAAEVFGA